MRKYLKTFFVALGLATAFYFFIYVPFENTAKQQRAVREALRTNTGEVGVVDGKDNGEKQHDSLGLSRGVGERDGEYGEVGRYIQEVFQTEQGVAWAVGTCMCESNCNPSSISPSGKYIGIFQFGRITFDSNCDGSIYKWRDQVVCAKKLYDKGETGRWPNCP